MMINLSKSYFPASYKESRDNFRKTIQNIQKFWPEAKLYHKVVSETEDLTIDWISADAIKSKDRLIILTTGLHGIEGFVGAAMMDLFVQEFLEQLDPETTAVQLVHVINPWGMQHQRRVNANNVDLNRNFMQDAVEFQDPFNQDYSNLNLALNPSRPIRNLWRENLDLLYNTIQNLTKYGLSSLRGAVLFGQQSFPGGLYYSGRKYQLETNLIMDLIGRALSIYDAVLQVDMHTGYGPRYQMSLINSPAEKRIPDQLEKLFNYPRILQADPDQFYSMKGDMINWVYQLQEENYPAAKYYGTAFEFGTYGEGILKEIASLKTMILENQVRKYGADSDHSRVKIAKDIKDLYFPGEDKWKEKALQDCRQAFSGILNAEGYLD